VEDFAGEGGGGFIEGNDAAGEQAFQSHLELQGNSRVG
jgi:hypothetical protein